jgi:hypothetical protein
LAGDERRGTNLTNANLSGAHLTNADLTNSNMTNANLTGAHLASANLDFSTLTNANLSGANLKNANSLSADFASAIFDSGTTYNQWTIFPDGFDPATSGLTLMASPPGDFDANDILDATDIDMLTANIRAGHVSRDWLYSMFDLNSDSSIDPEDHSLWVTSLKKTSFGDADFDNDVDFPDFVALANGFGNVGGWGEGDFDGSGDVQFPDFVLLADNFGNSSDSAAASVPEPSTALLLLLGLTCLLYTRRALAIG